MIRLSTLLSLALLTTALSAVPTSAEETETALPGKWIHVNNRFAMRPIAGTDPIQYEEDKDKTETPPASTTTFNPANMEVKCKAERGNYEAPKSATGRAKYEAAFQWQYGTADTNHSQTPDRYFLTDLTLGSESHAAPLRDESLSGEKPGKAESTGVEASAVNTSVPTMDRIIENKAIGYIADTLGPSGVLDGFAIIIDRSASASAGSDAMQFQEVVPFPQQPPPPVTKYTSKACNAEGRSYAKVTAPRPQGRTTW